MTRRNKLLFTAVAGTLAVAALIGCLMWWGYHENVRAAEVTSRNYAAIIEARLDATLRRTDAELQRLVSAIPAGQLSRDASSRGDRLSNELKASLEKFPEVFDIAIFGAKGEWFTHRPCRFQRP